ncbi:MAG TPA: hypothetical protein DEG69_18865 [Flavobacteriaceae bacterium]|nr:hypothetical protein [Flavobacteriaceae bacterium]
MTELDKFDLNGNGKIDPEEREIMLEHRRRMMIDSDQMRDSHRLMSWFALTGLLVYPSGAVICEAVGLPGAATHLSDMSNIYYISVAAIVGSYFGFSTMGKKQ